MNDKFDISLEESSENAKRTIGATIRKQRVSMNISIDKVAKDLKISKVYIQAIEDDTHDLVPAESYVRVYIKTIAEYLSLDSAALLKRLAEEKGKKENLITKESGVLSPLDEKDNVVTVNLSGEKKNMNFRIIALLFVLLLILGYFAVNYETAETEEDENLATVIIGETQEDENLDEDLGESDSLAAAEDSLVITPAAALSPMELQIRIVGDTSYIDAIADGVRSRSGNFTRPQRINVSANDSILVRLGRPSAVELFFAGRVVARTNNESEYWRFTRDRGAHSISSNEWRRAEKRDRQ